MMKKNGNAIVYIFTALFLALVGVGLFYALKKNNALSESHGDHAHHDAHDHCCSFKHVSVTKKEEDVCKDVVCDQAVHAHQEKGVEELVIEPVAQQGEMTSLAPCCDSHHDHHHAHHHDHEQEQLQELVASVCPAVLSDELLLIDCVLAKVGEEVITHSDVSRPGIDGERHTLAELVEHAAIYEKAKKFGMSLSKEMIEKDLKKAAEENNMTYAELLDSLKSAGLTQDELFKKFEALKVVQQLIGYKVGSNSVISEEETISYYHDNPVKTTARYYLKTATVFYDAMIEKEAKEKLRNELTAAIKYDAHSSKIVWGNPYWYEHDEIDPAQDFIFDLAVGQTSSLYDNGSCFLVYHLVDKFEEQLVPLEERRQEIADLLFRKKWSQLMSELITDVNKDISISYV